MYDTPIEVSADAHPTASVIWLHGLGADGNDFAPVAKLLNLPHVRFILPHAAFKKVTANRGYEMRAWYDVFGFEPGSREDETGIKESQAYINTLIKKENKRGIASNRIVLAGFSQGGAVVLQTALRHPQQLAGVMALSTYLPLQSQLASQKTAINQHIPIFMAHGTFDEVIHLTRCDLSKNALIAQQYSLEWHEYPMAHSVINQEIDDIRHFLLRVLPIKPAI
jgi:phospholipase/carboxylesterase